MAFKLSSRMKSRQTHDSWEEHNIYVGDTFDNFKAILKFTNSNYEPPRVERARCLWRVH